MYLHILICADICIRNANYKVIPWSLPPVDSTTINLAVCNITFTATLQKPDAHLQSAVIASPPPKMGCKKQQTNFTREAAQRSTIELYFVIHQNNKLSISASYCNKLIRNKTENKSPTQVHLFTPWFLIHVQSPTSYDWGQMPRKTWGSQVLHGAVLALTQPMQSDGRAGQYKANLISSTIVCTSK